MAEKDQHIKGRISWRSPSNIALVKYWGKKPVQIPANPSLSMTLSQAYTETTLEYGPRGQNENETGLEFWFEDRKQPDFEKKIAVYLDFVKRELPFLSDLHLVFSSRNTFPHSTGIASSASGMSALGLCLATLSARFGGPEPGSAEFFRTASRLSRLASGSACRSVYGGYTIWGEMKEIAGTSDEYAIPVPFPVHPTFRDMRDAILVVSSREKLVSSRGGHAMMEGHPYAVPRYRMANDHLVQLAGAMQTGNMEEFVRITETEALNLHAMMMSSKQSYILMEPGTVNIINAIRRFRQETGIPVCFTLDAGPNVHMLYPGKHETAIRQWIDDELKQYLENGHWIDDHIGPGPVMN
jgi:diphosphomevalonate decarboxylase